MKNIKILILVLCGVIILHSCSDFLDLEPVSSSTTGNAFKKAEDIEAALVGCYQTLYSEYYIWDNILLGDVRSDNCYAGPPADVDIYAYDVLTYEPSNVRLFYNWRDLFGGVSRANLVLLKIEEVEGLDASRKEEITGEAKFLRSLYYFDLVKLFGGVPLMETTGSADPNEIQIPRNTEQEVYNFIISDLEDAISKLSDNTDEEGRATKGAANALLAKVWAQSPTRDYAKVVQYCDAVINSPAGYRLTNTYEELFNGNNYNNSESIFEVQHIGGTPQGNWGPQLFLPPSISGDGWRKYATPSVNLINEFNNKTDNIRLNASVLFEVPGWIDEYWSPLGSEAIPFVYKQKHADGWNSGDQFYIIRLADILLLKAEALAKLGQGDRGRALLNQVRLRAGLAATTATDNQLDDAILNERRLELAFEAQRWYDLVRNNKVIEVMNNLQERDRISGANTNYNMTEHKKILPIPLLEIDRNPALEQNPGY